MAERTGTDTTDEVGQLRAQLAEAREDADRTLFRVTRLAKVVTALGRPNEVDESRPAAEVAEMFSADVGLLLLGDSDEDLVIRERWGVTTDLLPEASIALPPGVATGLSDEDTVLAGSSDRIPVLEALRSLDLRHVAWVRLVVDGTRLGYLVLGRRGELPFDGSDAHELRAIGQRVALSLDNARLHRRTEQQVVHLQRLLRLGTALAGTVEIPEAGRIIVQVLRDAAPSATAGVYRRGGEGWELVAHGGEVELPTGHLPAASMPGLARHPLRDGKREVGYIATVGMPDDEEHEQLLEHLVDVAGLAMSKMLLHERTAHQARHDALTGLCNRTVLHERMDLALEGNPAGVVLIFCDLDRFKQINDTLGHEAGDRVLVEVSKRLGGAIRPNDTIARHGGDEFVVLCTDVRGRDEAVAIAERMGRAIAPPIDLGGGERVSVSASLGLVLATPEATAHTLLRDADAAMYQAKAHGRDRFEIFDPTVTVELDTRNELEERLRGALLHGRLRAVYQPVVEIDTGSLVAVEALLRYQDDAGRLVPAAEFIHVAEESDLIVDLGAWMIDEATRQMATWQRDLGALAPPQMLINVASRQLERGVDSTVIDALERYGVEPSSVSLELTEGGLVSSASDVVGCLARLRSHLVKVGIDDFGTGFSTLTYLKRFPVDFIKIDREFVVDIVDSDDDEPIVHAILRLADALGLRTVAEGVETPEQRERLMEMGCTLAQGYLFSYPLLPDDLQARLALGSVVPPVPHAPAEAAAEPQSASR